MITFLTKTVAKAMIQYIVYILLAVSFIGVAAWYFSEPPKPPKQSWFSGKPPKKEESFVQKHITKPIEKNVIEPIDRALVQPVKNKVKQAVGYTPKPKPTFWQRHRSFFAMTLFETIAVIPAGIALYAIHELKAKNYVSTFVARLMCLCLATLFYLGSKAIFRRTQAPANLAPATWQQRWFGENVKYNRMHTWWILNRDTVYTVADWIVKSILFALLLATFKTRLQSTKLREYITFSEKSGMQPTKRG